jgi:1-phosphofructokinase family hexose kinase
MIVTVTANPILDRTLSVARLNPGEFHRAQVLRQELCGKGITVTRALAALGIPSKSLSFIGGITGQAFKTGLADEGFDIDFIDVVGETRQSTLIFDESSGLYTKINEPGPSIRPEHVAALQQKIERLAHPGDLWIFSGSLPPGAPADFYAHLIRQVQEHDAHAFLDSSADALRNGMFAHPFGIKLNTDEAAEYFQQPLVTDDDHARAARRFVQQEGAGIAAITRGARGLVLALKSLPDNNILAIPPQVEVRSPVAAGDAALAGILCASLPKSPAVPWLAVLPLRCRKVLASAVARSSNDCFLK